jgi:hypothetical protein
MRIGPPESHQPWRWGSSVDPFWHLAGKVETKIGAGWINT